ncbi:MAG: HAD family hydrolase [Dehalococcoidia bacterium]
MLSRARAVLFDLDDTLIDYSGNIEASWLAALGAAQAHLGGVDPAVAHLAIDRVSSWYWADPDRHREGRRDLRAASADIVRMGLADIGVAPNLDVCRAIANDYRDRRDAGLVLAEGAHSLLEGLRSRGAALGLVTNGATADQRGKIERFGLEPFFDHIQIEGEFGEGKPHPTVYQHALLTIGVPPSDCWFVGDHIEWDVAAPKRHGMHAIWIDPQGAGVPAGVETQPDYTIRHIRDLA